MGFTLEVCSVGLDKCIIACIHHCSVIQDNLTALKTLYVQPIHQSFPFTPWNHYLLNLFNRSVVLPFPEYHTVCSLFRLAFVTLSVWGFSMSFRDLIAYSSNHWIILHSLDIPLFIYLFTYWMISWLLPSFGTYE